MVRVFCGYDDRESIGFHVFVHSLIERASVPVQIIPLANMGLPEGSNAFTLSRFLVPHLCGYKGRAIFADASDMLMLGDIAELDALFDPAYAVQVVKHTDYQTQNPRKYVGTSMECDNRDYERKNHASLMSINCEHPGWRQVGPMTLNSPALQWLQFRFLRNEEIGELPPQWNVLADEGQSMDGAKILHFSSGIPAFDHYHDTPGAEHWHAARARMEACG